MSTLYITEYVDYPQQQGGLLGLASEPGADQTPITISGAHAESAAFDAGTKFVRIHTDTICSIVFAVAPVATTSSRRLAANQTEYFAVKPGLKVSVIANT